MKNYYYVDRKGDVQGPLPYADLLQMADSGELDSQTFVKEEDDGSQWGTLDSIRGEAAPDVEAAPSKEPEATPSRNGLKYFCRTNESSEVTGPFSVEELRAKLACGEVTLDHEIITAWDQSASQLKASPNWRALSVLLGPPEPAEAARAGGSMPSQPVQRDLSISRRSGWSSFSVAMAVLCGIVAFGGTIALAEGADGGLVVLIVGIAGCIQFAFLSFLIDVFTDIRWYLFELTKRD